MDRWLDMSGDTMTKPYIVALGGTTRAGSSTQKALALCLREIAAPATAGFRNVRWSER